MWAHLGPFGLFPYESQNPGFLDSGFLDSQNYGSRIPGGLDWIFGFPDVRPVRKKRSLINLMISPLPPDFNVDGFGRNAGGRSPRAKKTFLQV